MVKTSEDLSIIDSTLFELVDIYEYDQVDHLVNMFDISVENDESFTFADGIVSHNSASGMGLSVRDPRYQGFYSLRGKVLNTHEMAPIDILKNKELSELISIIGLDLMNNSLCDEDNVSTLNYGKIYLLQDMDADGNSIFCLMLRFLSRWPDLFKENRIYRVVTPLYVARKKGKPDQYFYSQQEYTDAKDTLKGYTIDFMKGLGSLEKADYKATIITDPKLILVELNEDHKLDMAFGDNADARKEWLLEA